MSRYFHSSFLPKKSMLLTARLVNPTRKMYHEAMAMNQDNSALSVFQNRWVHSSDLVEKPRTRGLLVDCIDYFVLRL